MSYRPDRMQARSQEPINRREATRRLVSGAATASSWWLASLAAAPWLGMVGCDGKDSGTLVMPDLVWGRIGTSDGRPTKPRAMVISPNDELYIVDMTGRVQVFDLDGNFQRLWRTPEILHGKPTGLGIAQDGSILVADTHYFRVLFYTPVGELQKSRTIGGEFGDAPGQFHFVTDVAQNRQGHIFAGQYGQLDQIQEFDSDGKFVRRWGQLGADAQQFARPQGLLFDDEELLWVADACNHRIQVFDVSGAEIRLVRMFGTQGSGLGELRYPYGLAFDRQGNLLVVEYGNHRVQRFTRDGKSLGSWGEPGTQPGQFASPWAIAVDSLGRIHVLDTQNHRVQRFAAT